MVIRRMPASEMPMSLPMRPSVPEAEEPIMALRPVGSLGSGSARGPGGGVSGEEGISRMRFFTGQTVPARYSSSWVRPTIITG